MKSFQFLTILVHLWYLCWHCISNEFWMSVVSILLLNSELGHTRLVRLEKLRKRLTHCDWRPAMQWPSPWRHHNDPKPRRKMPRPTKLVIWKKCFKNMFVNVVMCFKTCSYVFHVKWNPFKIIRKHFGSWAKAKQNWEQRGTLGDVPCTWQSALGAICSECKTLGSG